MQRIAVLNVVGLTESLLGTATPHLNDFRGRGRFAHITPAFPAVTCTAQATYLTGQRPAQHGIVANGWYHRELAEVQFWKQSNHVVHGRKVWEDLREALPGFTCAKLFWWYNMYSTADYSITPRPMYPADGRKVFDIYSWPYEIRTEIKGELGEFPFPTFWGPAAGMKTPQGPPEAASRWIAESAKWIERKYSPTLSLIYLPHLDYNLQRLGPKHPDVANDLRAIDAIVGGLMEYFRERKVRVIVLSEYGITPVQTPVHLNRVFRQEGWLTIKEELDRELIDFGASPAFAVADHQVAHIYVQHASVTEKVREKVAAQPGVARVLDRREQEKLGLNHSRAGDLIAVAEPDAWFTYYYWLDDARAPDFARCVDIHRKPGYDPVELFLDPTLAFPKAKIAWRLLKKRLGFRMLMDLIPLDAALVKGSHGAMPVDRGDFPILIAEGDSPLFGSSIDATEVYGILRRSVSK